MRFSSPRRIAGAAVFGAVIALMPLAASADPMHTITVSGTGDAAAVPDQAHLSAGVATVAATADAAVSQNARKMTEVFAALTRLGVPERAIQTSNFSVQPQYTANTRGDVQTITGYQVSNQVDVRLDDTKKLGPALDALVASGANQINSVSFSISNSDALMTMARQAAIADALKTAQTYAQAAGASVGSVISIREDGGAGVQPVFALRAARMVETTPTAAGEMSVTANVAVTYELK
ncbi:MAG TPA: SIMPL domain-containing protein [Rhizomicrobium sp.]|jgi:hypothetical protein|nr:SIMPL domain-containing protein [Rhizomicrobium sp.]